MFGFSLLVLRFLQDIDNLEMHGVVLTPSDFTVKLKGLPIHADIETFKADLWDWVE